MTYGLAFLVADAKIFGCPVTDYLEKPEDIQYIKTAGIVQLRQQLFRYIILQKLLSCYFCMGVWCGAAIHLNILAMHHYGVQNLSSYFLLVQSEDAIAIILSTVNAALLGGPACYTVDLAVKALEKAAN